MTGADEAVIDLALASYAVSAVAGFVGGALISPARPGRRHSRL
jgi:hypothetical protein